MSLKHLDSRDEEEGDALAVEVLTHAADKSVTIVVVSSLTDVAKWLRNHEELFVQKVQSVVILTPTPTPTPTRTLTPTLTLSLTTDPIVQKVQSVVIQGGVKEFTAGPAPPGSYLEPDSAHNNMFDAPSSEFFYRRCQGAAAVTNPNPDPDPDPDPDPSPDPNPNP